MSTYVCGHEGPCCAEPTGWGASENNHCWPQFTNDRLLWLYGEEGCADRDEAADADVAAWNRLGRRRAA